MKVKVWTLATCIPNEGKPLVEVFASEEAMRARFDTDMRAEWENNAPADEETGEPLPYPEDAQAAHDLIDADRHQIEESDGLSEVWGRYETGWFEIEIDD